MSVTRKPEAPERDRAQAKREVARAARRREDAAQERDEAIRRALALGIARAEVAELAGLTVWRIDQIRACRR